MSFLKIKKYLSLFLVLSFINCCGALDAVQGLLFPFYIYPTSSNINTLVQVKATYPNLPMRIVLNPSSGVGASLNADYLTAVHTLQKAGIQVVGYVATTYGNRPANEVEAEINQWILWYNPDGIFFDEMGVNHPYYRGLTTYAKNEGIKFTIGNPGTNVGTSCACDVDTINVFENSSLPNLPDYAKWSQEGYTPDSISMMSYAITTLPTSFITQTKTVFGWIYITNDNLPNPWDTFPSYFQALVKQIATE